MRKLWSILLLALLALAGCGGGGDKNNSVTQLGGTLQELQVSPESPSVPAGYGLQLTATGLFSDGSKRELTREVQWIAGDTEIAGCTAEGWVKGIKAGNVSIRAVFGETTKEIQLVVTDAELVSVEIKAPIDHELPEGSRAQLSALGIFSNQSQKDVTREVEWSTSNPSVATIDPAGLLTTLRAGETEIAATLSGRTASVSLRVAPIVLQALSIKPLLPESDVQGGGVEETELPPDLPVGIEASFQAIGSYNNGTTEDLTASVEWKPSDATVVAAKGGGKFEGLKSGKAEIVAALGNVSARAAVNVFPRGSFTLKVLPGSDTLKKGLRVPFNAVATFSVEGRTPAWDVTNQATWASSDATVATVRNDSGFSGEVTAVNYGTTRVAATVLGVNGGASVEVDGENATYQGVAITVPDMKTHPGLVIPLKATARWSDGYTRDVTALATWSCSTPQYAEVSNLSGKKGYLTLKAEGTARIAAAYGSKEGAATVQVTGAKPVALRVQPVDAINPRRFSFPYTVDCRFSDNSVVDVTNLADWSSANPAMVTVGNTEGRKGIIETLLVGETQLTANWLDLSKSTSIRVMSPVPLALYLYRGKGSDGLDIWRQYPLPEVCDGDWCKEYARVPAGDSDYIYRTYRIKANQPITITNIRTEGVLDAWFGKPENQSTALVKGTSVKLYAGQNVTFNLVSKRPAPGQTALVQWFFDAEGMGQQFFLSAYLRGE